MPDDFTRQRETLGGERVKVVDTDQERSKLQHFDHLMRYGIFRSDETGYQIGKSFIFATGIIWNI